MILDSQQQLGHARDGGDHGKDGHKAQRDIEIEVNHKSVTVTNKEMTGLEIKDAAIAQGVNIKRDFVLIKVEPSGKRDTIGDKQPVKLHNGLEFEAIADDDNS
jgi:hypothetical protein